jgi:hypothetical protein
MRITRPSPCSVFEAPTRDGKSATFGEFRRAAKPKGEELEKRLERDVKPERFICRSEVTTE